MYSVIHNMLISLCEKWWEIWISSTVNTHQTTCLQALLLCLVPEINFLKSIWQPCTTFVPRIQCPRLGQIQQDFFANAKFIFNFELWWFCIDLFCLIQEASKDDRKKMIEWDDCKCYVFFRIWTWPNETTVNVTAAMSLT